MQHLRWYDLLSSILFSSVKDLKVLYIPLNLLNWSLLSFFPQVQQVVYVLFGWLITWCLLPVYCSSMISSSLWEFTWFFCIYYVQPRLLYCYFAAMRSWRSWEFVVSQRRSSLFRTELGRDNKLYLDTCWNLPWEAMRISSMGRKSEGWSDQLSSMTRKSSMSCMEKVHGKNSERASYTSISVTPLNR